MKTMLYGGPSKYAGVAIQVCPVKGEFLEPDHRLVVTCKLFSASVREASPTFDVIDYRPKVIVDLLETGMLYSSFLQPADIVFEDGEMRFYPPTQPVSLLFHGEHYPLADVVKDESYLSWQQHNSGLDVLALTSKDHRVLIRNACGELTLLSSRRLKHTSC